MSRHTLLFASALVLGSLTSAALATETVRVATYNIQAVGSGSELTALTSVINRMAADVVLLQEVQSNETAQVGPLASACGYPWYVVANTSGTLSGALKNAVLSKFPITSSVSWSAAMASGDPAANDICRDILQAEIAVPETCAPLAVFTVHLKASSSSTDKFRRAVELIRVRQIIEAYLLAHPGANVVFGGDMNEDIGDGPFGQTFTSLPGGLPSSYQLGSDITFPVVYDPFNYVATIGGLGLAAVDATQEDSLTAATRAASGRRLDYVFPRASAPALGDEVYASPQDNGVDDAPLGYFLRKGGTALPSGTSALASDHYSVYADVLLESCTGVRYGNGYPGDHLLMPRAGIVGTGSIGDALFGLRGLYAAPNALCVLVLGRTRMLPPTGYPLDPYVPGAYLHVQLAGMIGLFTLFTDAAGEVVLNVPLPNDPAFIGQTVNTQWFISDVNGPNGVGAMTDAYELAIQP